MRSFSISLGLAAALLLAACGGDDQHSTPETDRHASALHVRAAGMVTSLGIT